MGLLATQFIRPTPQPASLTAILLLPAYVPSRGRPEPHTLITPLVITLFWRGQEFLPVVHRLRLPALP